MPKNMEDIPHITVHCPSSLGSDIGRPPQEQENSSSFSEPTLAGIYADWETSPTSRTTNAQRVDIRGQAKGLKASCWADIVAEEMDLPGHQAPQTSEPSSLQDIETAYQALPPSKHLSDKPPSEHSPPVPGPEGGLPSSKKGSWSFGITLRNAGVLAPDGATWPEKRPTATASPMNVRKRITHLPPRLNTHDGFQVARSRRSKIRSRNLEGSWRKGD